MKQSKTNPRIRWERTRVDDIRYRPNGTCTVRVAPRYLRPTKVETLQGVPSKAEGKLGWTTTTKFAVMVREAPKVAERDVVIKNQGFKTMDCLK